MTDIQKHINYDEYVGNDNRGKPKMDFVNELLELGDENLQSVCEQHILLSAYLCNDPLSDFHWMCDACYDVCVAQGKEDVYKKAFEFVARSLVEV